MPGPRAVSLGCRPRSKWNCKNNAREWKELGGGRRGGKRMERMERGQRSGPNAQMNINGKLFRAYGAVATDADHDRSTGRGPRRPPNLWSRSRVGKNGWAVRLLHPRVIVRPLGVDEVSSFVCVSTRRQRLGSAIDAFVLERVQGNAMRVNRNDGAVPRVNQGRCESFHA